eukprot:8291776-Pyramimonas_sp.AAC.1
MGLGITPPPAVAEVAETGVGAEPGVSATSGDEGFSAAGFAPLGAALLNALVDDPPVGPEASVADSSAASCSSSA